MQEILKNHIESYTTYGNRDQTLRENNEYQELEKKIESLKDEILKLIQDDSAKEAASSLFDEMDELIFYQTEISEKDVYEFGFYTGLKLGIDSIKCNKVTNVNR